MIEKYKLADFFKAHGLHHVVFERRLEDTIEKTENQDIYTRRLHYTIRVQNLMTFEAKSLDSLHINVGMTTETPSSSRRALVHSSKVAAAEGPAERRVSRCCRGAECSCRSALLMRRSGWAPSDGSWYQSQAFWLLHSMESHCRANGRQ